MKKRNKKHLERAIDIFFYICAIIFIIISSIAVKQGFHYYYIYILALGIYLIGLVINFMYKTTQLKIAHWKKNSIYIIYLLDIIYLIYSIILVDFPRLPYVFCFNYLLVLIEFRKQEN